MNVMLRLAFTYAATLVLCGLSSAAVAQPARTLDAALVPPRMAADVLDAIRQRDKGQLAVSEEDGRFLRLMVASIRAKCALEIGAASGYSAIWIGLGLRETGGRLVTVEYDPVRAREARENVRRAGLEDVVDVISGDAFAEIPKLSGAFDFVFLDAWKQDYQRFFDLVFPRLRPGGLFLAHNVVNKREEMEDFLKTIRTHPLLWTTIVMPFGRGHLNVAAKTLTPTRGSALDGWGLPAWRSGAALALRVARRRFIGRLEAGQRRQKLLDAMFVELDAGVLVLDRDYRSKTVGRFGHTGTNVKPLHYRSWPVRTREYEWEAASTTEQP